MRMTFAPRRRAIRKCLARSFAASGSVPDPSPFGWPPGPNPCESPRVQRIAQLLDEAVVVRQKTRFERDSADAMLMRSIEELEDGHSVADVVLKAGVPFTEKSMIGVRIDREFHDHRMVLELVALESRLMRTSVTASVVEAFPSPPVFRP